MKKLLKRLVLFVFLLLFIVIGGIGLFGYKAKYGFAIYDDEPPEIPQLDTDIRILLFQKTNGFRHGEAIKESRKVFVEMAEEKNWGLFITANGAVFQNEILDQFDLVIMDNATGPNLNADQKSSFKRYIEAGGSHLALHGSGDGSNGWKWYIESLIGAHFSHHSLRPQIQETQVISRCMDSRFPDCRVFPQVWDQIDEWYVFFDNPKDNGFEVLYEIDESTIEVSGNLSVLIRNKDFGMGEDHPVIWYKCLPNGAKTVYSSLGHNANAYSSISYIKVLEVIIDWLIEQDNCDLITNESI